MTVDWFLVDAPGMAPQEFQAWFAAKERHRSVFLRCCDAKEGSPEQAALEAEGRALKIEVDRLEQIARDAWLKAS
jgi:hypothetical protein